MYVHGWPAANRRVRPYGNRANPTIMALVRGGSVLRCMPANQPSNNCVISGERHFVHLSRTRIGKPILWPHRSNKTYTACDRHASVFFSNSIIVKFVLNVRKSRTRYTRHRGVGGRFISKISIVDSRLAHVYMCIRNRIDENAEFFFFLTLDVGVLRGCTQFI